MLLCMMCGSFDAIFGFSISRSRIRMPGWGKKFSVEALKLGQDVEHEDVELLPASKEPEYGCTMRPALSRTTAASFHVAEEKQKFS